MPQKWIAMILDDFSTSSLRQFIPLSASGSAAGARSNLVSQIPQFLVGDVLHSLLQDLNRRPHRSDDAATNDALRQLQMMEAERLHALVEVEHPFGNVVQPKKFFMPAIDVICHKAFICELFLKSVANARRDMQKGKKSWGI